MIIELLLSRAELELLVNVAADLNLPSETDRLYNPEVVARMAFDRGLVQSPTIAFSAKRRGFEDVGAWLEHIRRKQDEVEIRALKAGPQDDVPF